MGGPVRSGREALRALEEAIRIIRAFWSGERTIAVAGEHYSVRGLHPGPRPAHPIGIWLGVGKPRALALTGRLADGWVPSLFWAKPELVPEMMSRIDEGAAAADRAPAEIRRIFNVGGEDRRRGDTRPPQGPTRALDRDAGRLRARARLRHLCLLARRRAARPGTALRPGGRPATS